MSCRLLGADRTHSKIAFGHVAKVVIDFNGLHDARHCFAAKRSNARRHDRMTLAEILSQLVVECANAGGLSGF
jgi:hypothetical protein